MANSTLLNLPQQPLLNGTELVYMIQFDSLTQTWIDYVTTTAAIGGLENGQSIGPSMRQIKASMASSGVLVEVDQAVPADITNSNCIAWRTAFRMAQSDVFVSGFLTPLLGVSLVNTIWANAPNFPV